MKWASTSYTHLTEGPAQPTWERVLTLVNTTHFTQQLSDRFPQQSPNKVSR